MPHQGILGVTFYPPTKNDFITQNTLPSASCHVAVPPSLRMEPQGCNAAGHKFNNPTTGSVFSGQLSGSVVPNLPPEPLTPPVVSRMDMVFVVLVEGKALILMTSRSPEL